MDQLLTLSRLDSLDSPDGVEQIAMADLLQSAVMDIYPPAQQAGIDIRLNINAPEVTRTGQQLLLSLLVRNLLDNATRYSPRGSVVDVTLDARRFTVRDNGPGISPMRWRVSASGFTVRRSGCHRKRAGVIHCETHRRPARDARRAGQRP